MDNTNNNTNNKTKNKTNNKVNNRVNNKTNKNSIQPNNSQTIGGVHYTYIIILSVVLLFFVVFIYYERYYLPDKIKQESSKTKDFEILLDSKNFKNKPIKFEQEFGTTENGYVAYDENDNAIYHIDKYFTMFDINNKCVAGLTQEATIYMNIYFPDVKSNDGWYSSYKNSKPIIAFGNSPIISYNPFYNFLELVFKTKYASNVEVNKYIKLENIPNSKWLDIVIVIDNKKVKIYLNKKLEKYVILDNIPVLNFSNSHKIKFGQYNNNFNGLLNKVVFYKRSLLSSEIQSKDF